MTTTALLRLVIALTLGATAFLVVGPGVAQAAASNPKPKLVIRLLDDTPARGHSVIKAKVPRHLRGKTVTIGVYRTSHSPARVCNPRSPAQTPLECYTATGFTHHTSWQRKIRLPRAKFARIAVPVDLGSTPNVSNRRLEHRIMVSRGRSVDITRVTSTLREDARWTRWSQSQRKWVWAQVRDRQP